MWLLQACGDFSERFAAIELVPNVEMVLTSA
jgi:hypothetical protein